MVKRLITEHQVRSYFGQFGELYECVVPPALKYSVVDNGPDNEEIETRSAIKYEKIEESGAFDDEELGVEQYDGEKHGDFEGYMKKIGEGDLFHRTSSSRRIAGFAYIIFVTMDGFSRCTDRSDHSIDGIKCNVELAKIDNDEEQLKLESRRISVSHFPLEKLTAKKLKNTLEVFGKFTDVEFVSLMGQILNSE